MKTYKPMLFCLLTALMVCCLMPSLAFSDGPWDIDNGKITQTNVVINGVSYNNNTGTVKSGDTPGDGDLGSVDSASSITIITYNLLRQTGFVRFAESFIVKDFERRAAKKRTNRTIRR